MTSDNVLIKVRGLKKHYNGGTIRALDGIDIDINKGDVMVVIGPSGSGKSTFLRSLNLLEEPTDGSIDVEGQIITEGKIDLDKFRQKMGMVFQHFNLFPHKTILENLTIAPIIVKKEDKATAEKRTRQQRKNGPWNFWPASVWKTGHPPILYSFPAARNSVSPLSGPCA